ncbi:UDP-N-acetyl-D-mannosamine dehydrogenase [Candidatus Gugararchaeum adminiculabundum]|nr:UDP-N-acetyl-D-mannosamine dehydrogenase [Candidatus Gugararchaeum adminiculabundum]
MVASRFRKIGVVGLGYIGTPTAVMFANSGLQVLGIDVVKEKVEAINAGKCVIAEPGLPEALAKAVKDGKLHASADASGLKECDAVIICVETPLEEKTKNPNYSALKSASETVGRNLKKGALVLVESTLAPGTAKNIVIPAIEKESKLKAGEGFGFAHCPERIIPGKMMKEIIENDRVIGGYGKKDAQEAAELYYNFVKGKIYLTNETTAEVVKVIENTFRDVNIAFANEIARVCASLGVNVNEAIELANKHPRVNIHQPGAGVGGHCIPKDPYLLMHSVEGKCETKLVKTAREINEGMPHFTVQLVQDAFRGAGANLKGARIAILGVAYKADTDDCRDAPALKIINELKGFGAEVIAYDSYVHEGDKKKFGVEFAGSVSSAVKGSDAIVIVTDHSEIRKVALIEIAKQGMRTKIIIDGRNCVNRKEAEANGFVFRAIGR